MHGKGIGVAPAHHIAAESEIIVSDAHLPEQRSRKVGLIAELMDAPWRFQGSTQPKHGHMVVLRMFFAHIAVAEPVVGQENNQQIVPLRSLSKLINKTTDTLVQIVKGIQDRVFQPVGGNIPRLMAAQRRVAPKVMLAAVRLHYLLVERFEGDIVAHAPLGRFLFFGSVVFHPVQLLKPRSHQIAAHIGEIDVAAVKVARVVAFFLQCFGNAWQKSGLGGHLHHRGARKRRIAAPGAECAAVGAVGVGVEIGKINTLAGQPRHLWHDVLAMSYFLGENAAATFHQHHHDVGALCTQQRVGTDAFGAVESVHELRSLIRTHELVVGHVVGRLLERGKETEHRIDRGVVEKLVLRKINLPHIGGRFGQSTPDAYGNERNEQHIEKRLYSCFFLS